MEGYYIRGISEITLNITKQLESGMTCSGVICKLSDEIEDPFESMMPLFFKDTGAGYVIRCNVHGTDEDKLRLLMKEISEVLDKMLEESKNKKVKEFCETVKFRLIESSDEDGCIVLYVNEDKFLEVKEIAIENGFTHSWSDNPLVYEGDKTVEEFTELFKSLGWELDTSPLEPYVFDFKVLDYSQEFKEAHPDLWDKIMTTFETDCDLDEEVYEVWEEFFESSMPEDDHDGAPGPGCIRLAIDIPEAKWLEYNRRGLITDNIDEDDMGKVPEQLELDVSWENHFDIKATGDVTRDYVINVCEKEGWIYNKDI